MNLKEFDHGAFMKVILLFFSVGAAAAFLAYVFNGGCSKEQVGGINVQVTTIGTSNIWIGHPVVCDNDRYTPSQGWISDYQIGFRSDGVVVWKRISATKLDTHETRPK